LALDGVGNVGNRAKRAVVKMGDAATIQRNRRCVAGLSGYNQTIPFIVL
jgi:hypothetical protein